LRVSGKFAPERVKPEPVIGAELIVTATVPVEVSVSGSVDDEPTVTSPKLRLAGLTVSCGEPGEVIGVPEPLAGSAFTETPQPERIKMKEQANRTRTLVHQRLSP
jgi:hypothetical protein